MACCGRRGVPTDEFDETAARVFVGGLDRDEDGKLIIWTKGSKTAYKAIRIFEREVILDDDVVAEIK